MTNCHKWTKQWPVKTDHSAADNDQADCETRESDADDDSSWNNHQVSKMTYTISEETFDL